MQCHLETQSSRKQICPLLFFNVPLLVFLWEVVCLLLLAQVGVRFGLVDGAIVAACFSRSFLAFLFLVLFVIPFAIR